MVVLVTLCGMLLLLPVQVGMRQRHQELVVWRTLEPERNCCVPHTLVRIRHAGGY